MNLEMSPGALTCMWHFYVSNLHLTILFSLVVYHKDQLEVLQRCICAGFIDGRNCWCKEESVLYVLGTCSETFYFLFLVFVLW